MGFIGRMIGGVVAIGAGTMGLLFLGSPQVLDCERTNPPTNEGNCELKGVIAAGTFPIDSLQGATIQETASGQRTQRRYDFLLQTTEGNKKFADSKGGASHKQKAAVKEIETFIATPTQTKLLIQYGNKTKSYLFGGFFYLVALILIFGKSPSETQS